MKYITAIGKMIKARESRPTRACELKYDGGVRRRHRAKSRPTRACELKFDELHKAVRYGKVTPHAGV